MAGTMILLELGWAPLPLITERFPIKPFRPTLDRSHPWSPQLVVSTAWAILNVLQQNYLLLLRNKAQHFPIPSTIWSPCSRGHSGSLCHFLPPGWSFVSNQKIGSHNLMRNLGLLSGGKLRVNASWRGHGMRCSQRQTGLGRGWAGRWQLCCLGSHSHSTPRQLRDVVKYLCGLVSQPCKRGDDSSNKYLLVTSVGQVLLIIASISGALQG